MNSHGNTVSHTAETSRRSSLRVLCAEDDPSIADLLMLVLIKGGHKVECVENGNAALQRISADLNSFDLVVTDHEMPSLHGLELVRELRRLTSRAKLLFTVQIRWSCSAWLRGWRSLHHDGPTDA